ncbi:MAG TPA: hypothetical protein VG147_14150 [Solirubrobacteraceae bacterium]|jgi:hypothetical protein|nr:hypothetical protein [Solirubrobacteraceae bacterium]
MTTKERLHKRVDELSESEAECAQIVIEHGTNGSETEPELAPLPEGWGRLPSGGPAPNWVAGLDEVRRGR